MGCKEREGHVLLILAQVLTWEKRNGTDMQVENAFELVWFSGSTIVRQFKCAVECSHQRASSGHQTGALPSVDSFRAFSPYRKKQPPRWHRRYGSISLKVARTWQVYPIPTVHPDPNLFEVYWFIIVASLVRSGGIFGEIGLCANNAQNVSC